MPHHAVTIVGTSELFACDGGESVLHGLARTGKRGIALGCRSGGCGVCKVEIVAGSYGKPIMSRAHVWAQDEMDGRVLACRITPRGISRSRSSGGSTRRCCAPPGAKAELDGHERHRPQGAPS